MKRQTRFAMLPLLLAATFAAACSDKDPSGPDSGFPSGSVSFSYDIEEVGSGAYSASGALKQRGNGKPEHATFAAAGWEGSELGVMAYRAGANRKGDMFILAAPNVTGPKTIQLDPECFGDEDAGCAGVILITNTSLDDDSDFDQMCFMASGTITISSIANKRAQGTFSGEGVCISGFDDVIEFAVSEGAFDAPVIDHLKVN